MQRVYYIFAYGEHFYQGEKQRFLTCLNDNDAFDEKTAIEKMKLPENVLEGYFNGCDYKEYINTINGEEKVLDGVTYTDVMGQQCLEIVAVTDKQMMDTILEKMEKCTILNLDCDEETYWDWSGYDGVTKYKPLLIEKRIDEDGETQYDVVCDATYADGETTKYVENLNCIGFYILFNIYNTIIHS